MNSAPCIVQALLVLLLAGTSAKLFAREDKAKVLDLNQVDMEQVDDNWDNASSVPKVRLDNGLKIKDIVEPTSEYTYASFGKADPFTQPILVPPKDKNASTLPLGDTIPGAAPGSKEITVNSPLQAFPLAELSVKGVWQTAEGEFRAIIQTPKKEGVVVKNGDPISSGKILTIDKGSILVRLYKLRADGVREYEDSNMNFGSGTKISRAAIKLEPGKEAVFPGMEAPADEDAGAVPAAKEPAAVKPAVPQRQPAAFNNNKAAAAPPANAAPAANANQPLGWPYNNGAAPTPAQAPGSARPR